MWEAANARQARVCNFFHPEMLSTASTECPNVCSFCNNLVQREGVENSSTHVSAVISGLGTHSRGLLRQAPKSAGQRFRQCAARGGVGDGHAERRAVRMREKNDLEVDATLFLDRL